MKATELRIGNIVGRKAYTCSVDVISKDAIPDTVETTDRCKILDITSDQVRCLISGSIYVIETAMLKGIPITPEWVKSFGLVEDNGTWEFPYNLLPSYVFEGNEFVPYDSYYYKFMPCVKYVHELQNLYFTITGREL